MKTDRIHQKRWLMELLRDNQIIEVRREHNGNWSSGYFDSLEALLRLPNLYPNDNLYTTINSFTGKTATNRIGTTKAIGNGDITAIRRLFFDFDPEREKGTASTDAELQCAVERAKDFRAVLSARGWPEPAFAISGNGAHLMYRIHLNTDLLKASEWLKRLYSNLSAKYSDDVVKFDTSVHNAGRITRLYGSVNHKGIVSAERPFRQSSIQLPARYDNVSKIKLWNLIVETGVSEQPKKTRTRSQSHIPSGDGDYQTLDIPAWLSNRGVLLGTTVAGYHAIRCPWQAEHTTSRDGFADAVVFANPEGSYPGFNCFHDHCADRDFFDVLGVLGGADQFCRLSFRGRANG